MNTLSERFAKSEGRPLEVNGVLVESIYRRSVSQGQAVRIRRVQATAMPVQGLRLKVDKGSVVINGRKHKDVILWADTAPDNVEVVCETGKASTAELRVWNCWKADDGVMQAWIGDAGMVIDEDGQRVSIRAGDGTHPFAPRDLQVELLFG
jgi:hypothetical protein